MSIDGTCRQHGVKNHEGREEREEITMGSRILVTLRVLRGSRECLLGALAIYVVLIATAAFAQELPPELTQPVNDFANVIDQQHEQTMEELIRSLQQASGDVVVVATVPTFQPYADIREYAVKMFENHGHGIGQRGKDNGVLILLAVNDRQVRVEVGYDLEQFITDGFAGETSRQYMAPEFRRGNYGAGLQAGLSRIVARIAQGRNVTLQGVRQQPDQAPNVGSGGNVILALFILFIVLNAIGRTRRRRRFYGGWGPGGWSGWNSGVGPFGGGGWGGGGRGGGFGGGFGGFGGGRSGGGGGGAGW
jgi:uncharacterized protein